MNEETVQERLSAIAEPTRFRIVELLKNGPLPVGAIVGELGLGQPQVSRHLRILTEAGVVTATKRAQQRIYRLRAEPMREVGAWAQGYAALWSDRMDRLGEFLDSEDTSTDGERP